MGDDHQFSTVRRGLHPGEVKAHLARLNDDLQMTADDRDSAAAQARSLAKQLDAARVEIEELHRAVDRLAAAPTSTQGMSDRLTRMLRLAEDEAEEIRATAHSDAAERLAIAEQNAESVRAEAHRLAIETKESLSAAQTEANEIVAAAHAEASRISVEAEHQRKSEQHDFETTMRERRAKLTAELDDLERSTRAKAAQLKKESDLAAAQQLAQARETAENLRVVRANILNQLMGIREQLDQVPDQLSAIEDEKLID
ncbi:hypothetical protein [Smaragdicoccus niigatensis]|uniref:hypothetical protein n=1 Tax=Smaragdicoccus niigatensis TaxID=359359 RepID=UPI00037223BB|nr:hypothetical protein [Smaragdicoccus niigatensis]